MAGKLAKLAQMPAYTEEIEVWPENWPAINFFLEYCATQWRTGMAGATGLDYTAVLACIRTLGLARDKRDELFADVRTLERGALEAMGEKAK